MANLLHTEVHEKNDARTFDPKTQEEVLRWAIKMLRKGRAHQSAADELEVSRAWAMAVKVVDRKIVLFS